jgi:hypothetical protein
MYILISFLLSFTLIVTLQGLISESVVPIFFNGGVAGEFVRYKNSSHPPLYYLTDYPQGCSGVWSCSSLIQKLHFKYIETRYVTLKLNPFNVNNLQELLDHDPVYFIPFYSLLFSLIAILISSGLAFFIKLNRICKRGQELIINGDELDSKIWTRKRYILFGLLFVLRLPMYISIGLVYAYLLPNLYVDKSPDNLKLNETVRVFTLLAAYALDNFYFPYETLT